MTEQHDDYVQPAKDLPAFNCPACGAFAHQTWGGLPAGVQPALDAVRVIGNNAVHPGQIDLQDDPAIAGALFRLVNLIVEKLITDPRVVDEIYDGLPEGAKDAIAKRDSAAAK